MFEHEVMVAVAVVFYTGEPPFLIRVVVYHYVDIRLLTKNKIFKCSLVKESHLIVNIDIHRSYII